MQRLFQTCRDCMFETCRDWYRIEDPGRWLDQRVAFLADQPLCSDKLDDQLSSLLCQSIHQQQFQPQLATALVAEIGLGSLRTWRGDRRACVKISPSVWGIFGDGEERQICTTSLFAESVGLCLCFLTSCAMYKDNAVGNMVAGRELVFRTTARLSDLSMPLKGEVRRSPEQSARQPIAGSGKFVWRAY